MALINIDLHSNHIILMVKIVSFWAVNGHLSDNTQVHMQQKQLLQTNPSVLLKAY